MDAKNQEYSLYKPRVLVVDDKRNMRILLEEMLNLAGCEVDVANDGQQGLELYLQAKEGIIPPYDLILTDCQMPRMGGIEFMRSMRERGNGTPVVLSSARPVHNSEWEREGFACFLPKPYTFNQLVDCVRKYSGEGNPQ